MRLNNPSQRRRGYEKETNEQNCRVSSSKKIRKIHPMVIGPEEMPILKNDSYSAVNLVGSRLWATFHIVIFS